MSPELESCIAYLVARLVGGEPALFVHDLQRGTLARIGGTIRDGFVALYDYDRASSLRGLLPHLGDSASGLELRLELEGVDFSLSGSRLPEGIVGAVSGRDVEIRRAGQVSRYRLVPL